MTILSERLKSLRCKRDVSLKEVAQSTGITDSRLNRMENGKILCPPKELRKLANYYKFPVIALFMEAEYLDKTDIEKYKFSSIELLNSEELSHIQDEIDFINWMKEGQKNV